MPDSIPDSTRESIKPDVCADAPIRLGSRAQTDPVGFVIDTLTGLDLIG
jgi:hypothetical protein